MIRRLLRWLGGPDPELAIRLAEAEAWRAHWQRRADELAVSRDRLVNDLGRDVIRMTAAWGDVVCFYGHEAVPGLWVLEAPDRSMGWGEFDRVRIERPQGQNVVRVVIERPSWRRRRNGRRA